MTFLASATRFDLQAMTGYILAIPKIGFKPNPNTGRVWNPKGVVLHNTAAPSLGQWAHYSDSQKQNWGNNLNTYYKGMQWHSGPHFCGTPESWSLVLCDPLADGVHDSCRNADYFGVETVGNFAPGADDPASGPGLAAMKASANIIASLCARFDFDPDTAIDFHRNCKRDGHACPGARVSDGSVIALVKARLAEIRGPALVS
jgi:hypothetical protein